MIPSSTKSFISSFVQVSIVACIFFIASCGSGQAPPTRLEDEGGAPADQNIGERLFVETRFAEYFAANMSGANAPLAVGDPVVGQVQNVNGGPMPGPFAGQSVNCRSCHFVVEFQGVPNAGNRTYADFTDHSTLPLPMNGFTHTQRNAMQMVNSLIPRIRGQPSCTSTVNSTLRRIWFAPRLRAAISVGGRRNISRRSRISL